MKKTITFLLVYFMCIASFNAQICFYPATNFSVAINPSSVISFDFNSDGFKDLASANFGSNNVSVLLGTGTGNFGGATSYTVGSNPSAVTCGDFNGDGKLDLATSNAGSYNISIILGTGTGIFGSPTNFTVSTFPAYPTSLVSSDFNGDGKLDLAVTLYNGYVSIMLGNGLGGFGTPSNLLVNAQPYSVVSADFNGDGYLDLAAACYASASLSVLLGSGSGSFSTSTSYMLLHTNPASVISVDFNNDGFKDLAVATGSDVEILLGVGNGTFGSCNGFAAGSTPYSVISADYNGDGFKDLAVANKGSNNVSVLLGNGTGSFGTATNFASSTQPYSIISSDFNSDSKSDLAVANYGSNNLSVLLNGPPIATISGAQPICAGDNSTLTAIGAITCTWSANAGGVTTQSVLISPTSSDSYTLTSNNGVCVGSTVATVIVNLLPTITIFNDSTSLCAGNTTTITANGASTYTWNTAQTGTNIAITPTVTTTYTVTGTDVNGCKNSTTIIQNVNNCTTGIKQSYSGNFQINIYPNPTSEEIFIDANTTDKISVDLYDVNGSHVYSSTIMNNSKINVSTLSEGVYSLTIKTGDRIINKKLVILR